MKNDLIPLSSSECDELILLLGGTVRERQRPTVKVCGVNRRRGNWAALGDIVYRSFYEAEKLAGLEKQLKTETDPKAIAEIERTIPVLKPMCANTETEAIKLAVAHFHHWGFDLTFEFIQREITQLKKEAGAKCKGKLFWLNEWPEIKAKAEAEGNRKLERIRLNMADNLHS